MELKEVVGAELEALATAPVRHQHYKAIAAHAHGSLQRCTSLVMVEGLVSLLGTFTAPAELTYCASVDANRNLTLEEKNRQLEGRMQCAEPRGSETAETETRPQSSRVRMAAVTKRDMAQPHAKAKKKKQR